MDRLAALFATLTRSGVTTAATIRERLQAEGIQPDDARLQHTWRELDRLADQPIDLAHFAQLVGPEVLMVERVLMNRLVIPDWPDFCQDIQFMYDQVAPDRSGANADYIPILRDADPERWGVAVCSEIGRAHV